jgi:hypothetical protein
VCRSGVFCWFCFVSELVISDDGLGAMVHDRVQAALCVYLLRYYVLQSTHHLSLLRVTSLLMI